MALEEADPALAEITNFRQYSASFASAGQPTREQFQAIADNGFERVVYIALTNNPNALPDADLVVKGLGMEYMQIPVDFSNPRPSDYYAFADSMARNEGRKTLQNFDIVIACHGDDLDARVGEPLHSGFQLAVAFEEISFAFDDIANEQHRRNVFVNRQVASLSPGGGGREFSWSEWKVPRDARGPSSQMNVTDRENLHGGSV